MEKQKRYQPVKRTITVPLPLEDTFQVFSQEMSAWWPQENTFSEGDCRQVVIEPFSAGRWFEVDSQGNELLWGNIALWRPPVQLGLTWQITASGQPEPDPANASRVEVKFKKISDEETKVTVTHSEFQNHGEEQGLIWREGMDSPEGWSNLLAAFETYIWAKKI